MSKSEIGTTTSSEGQGVDLLDQRIYKAQADLKSDNLKKRGAARQFLEVMRQENHPLVKSE